MITERIKLLLIYEILGRPPEHIKEALEKLIEQIGKNPGIKILERKVHEPHAVEKEKNEDNKEVKESVIKVENLFSTFAEVEIEANSLDLVFQLALNTLPSSIQILEPSELKLKNFDLNSVLGGLTAKLHQYDEIAKAMMLERNNLINIIKEIQDKTGVKMVRFEEGAERRNEETKEEKKKKGIEGLVEDGEGKKRKKKKKV